MEKVEFAAQTRNSPVHATIWPTTDLKTYEDPQRTKEVGQLKTAAAYRVLEEIGDSFAVSVDGKTVYVESNHCMINLPEYLGDLCSYQIANSDSSLYMVHEYEIPAVTAVVTAGYERVKQENGEYLVPLLYPTAKKVALAAKSALEQGYRLKIHDAFRPNKATLEIFDRMEGLLEQEIPEKTVWGGVMEDLPDPDPVLTYSAVMTNCGAWALNDFLAKGVSQHNYGIAVDLTLETLDGEPLKMQTSIHDLSWYSVVERNNENAKLLASIMKAAGMEELDSEWWHFQDNETKRKITLHYVREGLGPAET